MLFVFAALLALVAAQCNPVGKTYEADGFTLTFGAPVGADWVPGLINWKSEGVSYAVWKQATDVRWEVEEFGSTTGEWCDQKGSYNLEFFNGCDDAKFTVLWDNCGDRRVLLDQETFHVVEVVETDPCLSASTQATSHYQESDASPRLSNDAVIYTFGTGTYVLASVGGQAVIVQRWRLSLEDHKTEIVDLASFPSGYACDATQVGTYLNIANWGEECSVRFCGATDACLARSQLVHNSPVNGYEGDFCSNEVIVPGSNLPTQCSDGRQWLKDPNACVAQNIEGGCAFCKGIAMGESTSWCINRDGANCNDIFESSTSQAFCNQEFECPASTASVSFVVFICSLLALFFH